MARKNHHKGTKKSAQRHEEARLPLHDASLAVGAAACGVFEGGEQSLEFFPRAPPRAAGRFGTTSPTRPSCMAMYGDCRSRRSLRSVRSRARLRSSSAPVSRLTTSAARIAGAPVFGHAPAPLDKTARDMPNPRRLNRGRQARRCNIKGGQGVSACDADALGGPIKRAHVQALVFGMNVTPCSPSKCASQVRRSASCSRAVA